MDTLSDVVALLKSHRSCFAGLKAGGDWALDFPPPVGITFNAVGGIARLGETVDLFLIGGRFSYGDDACLLLEGLPPVVRISARSEQASVLRVPSSA